MVIAPHPDLSCVSIVVLSHNRKDALHRNLEALTTMVAETGCELIVVDNASTDGSKDLIASTLAGCDGAVFIANETNSGVAAGRNRGWRLARREFILSLDDDCAIAAGDVALLASLLRQSKYVGIVGPEIIEVSTGKSQLGYGNTSRSVANFHGACHMVRRDLARNLGFNDERCLFGGEELDLSIRVRAAGFDVRFLPKATALHDHEPRQGAEAKLRRRRWVYNHVRVFHRHFPFSAALPVSLRFFVSHVASATRACGPGFAATLVVEALRGLRDGRGEHRPVPKPVLRFYRDPDLRPDFGNRPLWRKLMDRLGRS